MVSPKNRKSLASDIVGMVPPDDPALAYRRPFLEVREFLGSLRRQKSIVLASLGALLGLAALYSYLAPRSYTATAQLLMDLNRPLTNASEQPGADAARLLMGPVIDSQVEIIRSKRILSRVISKTGYRDADEAAAVPAGGVSPKLLDKFERKLDVRRKGVTLIMLVQFTDRDPARAALVVNTLVDEYLAERQRMETAAAQRAVDTLKSRLVQVRTDLARSEEELQRLGEANDLFTSAGSTLDERDITETATQLNLARAEEAKLLADLRQWEDQSKGSSGLAAISKLSEARHKYEVARSQVEILEKSLDTLKQQYAGKSVAIGRFLEMQKETQGARDNYLAIVNRIKQLETDQSYSMLDVQMLDNAEMPQEPSSPNVPLILAGGLLGGLGLGISLAMIRDHLSTVLRNPQLVQSNLGVPNIASLRQLSGRNADPFAQLARDPNSPFVQGILTIHRFLAETRSSSQRVIAIVSVDEGNGKSTVAAALAQYAAAITHQKTAVIDADVHRHALSDRFAPEASRSFADAVEGNVTPLGTMTNPQGCAFSLCPAPRDGNTLANIEMAMSVAMSKFVRTTAREFDLVILDTSGLLDNVEARALVTIADIVLLVVDARRTTAENVAAIRELTPDLEGKLAGVVLNHVS